MTILKAHFDGKVLVPDEPVDLPLNCALEVHVMSAPNSQPAADSSKDGKTPLQRLADVAKRFPAPDRSRADGAAQHDHYLYDLPKRP